MNRLWQRIRDWALLGGLLSISLLVLLTANEPMLRGLRARSLEATAAVEGMFAGLGRYVRALDENDRLRDQNITLSNQVALMRAAEAENHRLESLLGLADTLDYSVTAARIIFKDITHQRNEIMLDVGRVDGIRENMAVIDTHGIVGKVILVSEHSSWVMTFLNTEFYVPARILPSMTDGILRWKGDGFNRLVLDHIVLSAEVAISDQVVISGTSSIFQPAYPVGSIDSVFVEPGMSSWTIFVSPFSQIDNISHVFVVTTPPANSVESYVLLGTAASGDQQSDQ